MDLKEGAFDVDCTRPADLVSVNIGTVELRKQYYSIN